MKGIGLVIILIFGACCSTGHAQNPDTLWTMKLPGPGWQKNQLFHLIPTPDNNYVAAAFDHPEEVVPTQDGGFILAAAKSYMSSYKGFLLELDANGNEQWMQTYNDYDQDQIHSVSPTPDGGYIAVGHTSVDGLIIKFSPYFGALGLEETINISGFSISHNIPDTFRASTVISWKSRMPGHAVIRIFDFTGREIMVLADENQRPGEHKVVFDAMGLPAGIYFYQLNVNGVVESGKMILTE